MSLTLSLWPAFLNRMCSARMVGWETTRNLGYLKMGTSIPVSSLWRYNEPVLKLIIGFPFLGISAFVYVFPPHAECHPWDSLLRHRIRHGWWNVVASHVSLYINHHLAAQTASIIGMHWREGAEASQDCYVTREEFSLPASEMLATPDISSKGNCFSQILDMELFLFLLLVRSRPPKGPTKPCHVPRSTICPLI